MINSTKFSREHQFSFFVVIFSPSRNMGIILAAHFLIKLCCNRNYKRGRHADTPNLAPLKIPFASINKKQVFLKQSLSFLVKAISYKILQTTGDRMINNEGAKTVFMWLLMFFGSAGVIWASAVLTHLPIERRLLPQLSNACRTRRRAKCKHKPVHSSDQHATGADSCTPTRSVSSHRGRPRLFAKIGSLSSPNHGVFEVHMTPRIVALCASCS